MKKAILLLFLTVGMLTLLKAQPPQKHLPQVLKFTLSDKELVRLDSIRSVLQNELLGSQIPSNRVQYLIALLNQGLDPFYRQVPGQMVVDTTKKTK